MADKRLLLKIPPEVLYKARKKLDEIFKILRPHLVVLTPSERLSLRKTGCGFMNFLGLSHAFSVESPELFPAFMETEVFREEYFRTHELWTLVNVINQLREYVSDIEMLSESRTQETAMAFYQMVKIAARHDIPGARVVFDELKSAYPSANGGRRKQKREEDEGQLELFTD